MPVNPDGAHVPLRLGRLLGDRGRRGRAAARAPAIPRTRAARRSRRSSREAAAGSRATRSRRSTPSARWLGFGLAGLVNVFNPQVVVLGGLFGAHPPFVEETLGAELDSARAPACRGRSCASSRRRSASTLRCSGAAELAFEPLLADPSLWIRPAVATA